MTANTSTGQRWSLYARLPKNYRRRSLRPCIISPKIRSVWPIMLRRRPAVPLSGCAMNSWQRSLSETIRLSNGTCWESCW
jgi:hypothetical protein